MEYRIVIIPIFAELNFSVGKFCVYACVAIGRLVTLRLASDSFPAFLAAPLKQPPPIKKETSALLASHTENIRFYFLGVM